jgi:hypothetical protein
MDPVTHHHESKKGSILLEVALWAGLIVFVLALCGNRFARTYRGFYRALEHQRSTLHY